MRFGARGSRPRGGGAGDQDGLGEGEGEGVVAVGRGREEEEVVPFWLLVSELEMRLVSGVSESGTLGVSVSGTSAMSVSGMSGLSGVVCPTPPAPALAVLLDEDEIERVTPLATKSRKRRLRFGDWLRAVMGGRFTTLGTRSRGRRIVDGEERVRQMRKLRAKRE